MPSEKKKPRIRRVIRSVLLGIGAVLLAVVFYLVMIMGRDTEAPVTKEQPLLSASAPLAISEANQLTELMKTFPVPVLAAGNASGLILQSAASYDVAFEDGFARQLTITYTAEDGTALRLDSIYPARALSLLDKNYTVSATAGHVVAGQRTVRMESKDCIRLHMQTADGLYVITLPGSAENNISSLIRTLQLVKQ